MPKIATDYSTREISFYKFVCNDPEIQSSYVGHTVAFDKRKIHHKSACNNPNLKNNHLQIYQIIREYGGWDNWRMLEIESRLVKDKREAERIEQEYIDKLKTDMNTRKSFINEETLKERMKQYRIENADKIKEYRFKNADKIKEQMKQYRIENADKIKQNEIENADKNKKRMKQYRIENADKNMEYRIENADKIKEYRIKNADKLKEQKRQFYLKKKEKSKFNASSL